MTDFAALKTALAANRFDEALIGKLEAAVATQAESGQYEADCNSALLKVRLVAQASFFGRAPPRVAPGGD